MRLYNVPVSLFLAIAILVLLAQNASAIVFDDGKVHVVDAANSFPFEGVLVDDGPPLVQLQHLKWFQAAKLEQSQKTMLRRSEAPK